MRGKGVEGAPADAKAGITPAYAGKRRCLLDLTLSRRDHPRVCGEKKAPRVLRVPLAGSPPRMRGKAIFSSGPSGLVGITPACAGKSPVSCPVHRFPEDHPRMCGEKSHVPVCKLFAVGITPACAGKRTHDLATHRLKEDHPRMCGEKKEGVPTGHSLLGSPPHVRGKV